MYICCSICEIENTDINADYPLHCFLSNKRRLKNKAKNKATFIFVSSKDEASFKQAKGGRGGGGAQVCPVEPIRVVSGTEAYPPGWWGFRGCACHSSCYSQVCIDKQR